MLLSFLTSVIADGLIQFRNRAIFNDFVRVGHSLSYIEWFDSLNVLGQLSVGTRYGQSDRVTLFALYSQTCVKRPFETRHTFS